MRTVHTFISCLKRPITVHHENFQNVEWNNDVFHVVIFIGNTGFVRKGKTATLFENVLNRFAGNDGVELLSRSTSI